MVSLVATAVCFLLGLIAPALLANLQDCMTDLASRAFAVDAWIDDVTSSSVSSNLINVFTNVGISLTFLIFLKKGLETYILYTDGDPESSPLNLLTLFAKALAVVYCGNIVLSWFGEIVANLSVDCLDAVKSALGTDYQWSGLVDYFSDWSEESISSMLFGFILVVVFAILFWILYFKCLSNGIELFILKIAMPICAMGLVNSDKGIFKNYVMSLAKCLITIMVQLSLSQLGFSIVIASFQNNNIVSGAILGIICLVAAHRGPKLLQEFLIPSQSGNGMMKAYYSMNMARSVKAGFSKMIGKV